MEKKICLSVEQMRMLQGLGVETKDASMCWVRDPEGNYILSLHNESCYEMAFMNPVPAFTLQDMIDKFPKTVYSPHGIPGCVSLVKGDRGYACFSVAYKTCAYVNPMDAAYDMLIWLARNRYLKGGEK